VHSDQALIDRCLAGESEAFGELVRMHQDRLFGTLAHLLGSVHDAADVAQDAFVLAYRNLSKFRGQSAFYSWLFRIAYNAAVNHRRRNRMSASLDNHRQKAGDGRRISKRPRAQGN
jgi:RNA polymerase sigma-70 factor (ECF subfamily)